MEMVRLRDLLQEEGPAEKVEKQPTIRVRRGTVSEVVTIPRSSLELVPAAEPSVTLDPVQPIAPAVESETPTTRDTDDIERSPVTTENGNVDVTQVIGQ